MPTGKTKTASNTWPRSIGTVAVMIACALCLHSCDEELPVYVEPTARLDAKIEGEYFLSDVEHSLRVYVRITNLYDETLDGQASLTGSVVVFAARDTTIRKTLTLTRANLVAGTVYASGLLKIDPKETIVLKATWDFPGNTVVDDYGRRLSGDLTNVRFFSYVQDPNCQYRQFAKPEDFVLQGNVTVFSRRAPVIVGPRVFRFCFVTSFVPVFLCPRVVTVVPCSNWP